MGSDGNKNHIQTLFLIFNSFNGFGFGLFLFAFGAGRAALTGWSGGLVGCVLVGLGVLALAVLGYCGAALMNRKMLHIYSLVTIGGAAFEVVHLAILTSNSMDIDQNNRDLGLQAFYVTMICIIVIATVSVSLACTLSLQIRARALGAVAAGARSGWK